MIGMSNIEKLRQKTWGKPSLFYFIFTGKERRKQIRAYISQTKKQQAKGLVVLVLVDISFLEAAAADFRNIIKCDEGIRILLAHNRS